VGAQLHTVAIVAALLAALLAFAAGASAATRRTPTLAPSDTVVDGPNPGILALSGLTVARDGTGGLVYLRQVAGVAHVFVSELVGGTFHGAVQVDAGLASPSSQPVIAGTNGGELLVAFVNRGELYAAEKPSATGSWGAPVPISPGAASPSLSMSTFGKAYLAFTGAGDGGHDVRVAYFNLGHWALAAAPLDVNPADDSGTGSDAPQVATAGDGTAIVAWGEAGHIYTRRVLRTSPSVIDQQVDPPSVGGWSEVSASDPQISTGGDSSYAAVAFNELLAGGGMQQTRVLVNGLRASDVDGARAADGLSTPGADGADQPRIAVNEYGAGFVTAEQDQSHNLFTTTLGGNENPESTAQVNSLVEQDDPDAVPATAGTVSTLIAWQQSPGSAGPPEIRIRYASDGSTLGPEQIASSPELGSTDANLGLFAGGDLSGDAAVAWVQGSGSQTRIVAGQLFQAPGSITPATLFSYATSVHPILTWSPASERWGTPRYTLTVDGTAVATATTTTIRAPIALSQGRHVWAVTASNLAGLSTVSRSSTVFVDSVAPQVSFKITGTRHPGSRIWITVRDTDTPHGIERAQASGIASVKVGWGDGSKSTVKRVKSHVYSRSHTYIVKVIVTDRAGNRTVKTKKLKITAARSSSRSRRKR
jgi:hypothetical protein